MDELGHKVEKESPYVFVRQLQKTEKRGKEDPFRPLTSFCNVFCSKTTMFENHRKNLTQHCERSELRLHFH